MRKGIIGSFTTMLAGVGVAFGQALPPSGPPLGGRPGRPVAAAVEPAPASRADQPDDPKDKEKPKDKEEPKDKAPDKDEPKDKAKTPDKEEPKEKTPDKEEPKDKAKTPDKEEPKDKPPTKEEPKNGKPEEIPAPKNGTPELIPPPKNGTPQLPKKEGTAPSILPLVGAPVPPSDCGSTGPLTGCTPNCCTNRCPPAARFDVSAEYLLWWVKDGPVPVPLVTTSPTATLTSGFLTDPAHAVVFGNQHLDYGTLSGIRVTAGYWFTPEPTLGIEGSGFLLEQGGSSLAAVSNPAGSPLLARPVINGNTGLEDAARIAFPGALTGGIVIGSTSRLWGADANLRGRIFQGDAVTWDLLAGFRYLSLEEDLNIAQTTGIIPGGVSGFNGAIVGPGNTIIIRDGFDTRSQFYGGQLGTRVSYRQGGFFAELLAKVALGDTHEGRSINGNTTLVAPGAQTTVPGGLLALSSNIGHSTHDEFAVVPEVGINVGYQVTPNVRAFVGYNFLYWSDVIRPGDQISRVVNPTQVPSGLGFGPQVGPSAPTSGLKSTDFWTHGVTFGIGIRF